MTDTDSFDLVTEAGVRYLQEEYALEKDGIVGPKTWEYVQQPTRLLSDLTSPLSWIQPGVPYYQQRDNEYRPEGTCNVTSLAMVLAFHGVQPTKAAQLEDELYLRLQQPDALAEFNRSYPQLKRMGYKPRHIHGMLGWLAKQYGFKWKFSDKTTASEMAWFGMTKGPLITSGSFTSAGHIIVIVGMTIGADLVVHDPYGNWDRGYQFDRNGKFRIYNRENMSKILAGNSETKKRSHQISRS